MAVTVVVCGIILCIVCSCAVCGPKRCIENLLNCHLCDQSGHYYDNTVRSRPVIVQRTGISSEQSSAGVVYRTGPEPSNSRNLSFVGVDNVNNPCSSLGHNASTNALSANNDSTNTNALSTNKDCSNTLNDDAPPPYSSTDEPPSYDEIDL